MKLEEIEALIPARELDDTALVADIPAKIRLNRNLTSDEKLLYVEITAMYMFHGSKISQKQLADITGQDIKSIEDKLFRLQQLGYIMYGQIDKDEHINLRRENA